VVWGGAWLTACGGLVDFDRSGPSDDPRGSGDEGEAEASGATPDDGAIASPSGAGGGMGGTAGGEDVTMDDDPPGEVISNDVPEEGQPGLGEGCGCPTGPQFEVLIFDPDGDLTLFERAPEADLAPGGDICVPMDWPSAFHALCSGPRSFLLGACNDQGACVEMALQNDLLIMNLWRPDKQGVRSISSSEFELESWATSGVVSGNFSMKDQNGGGFAGAFTVCDLLGSAYRLQTDPDCHP